MPAMELPPLGLYLHIPWCRRKCPYCDFNSHRAPPGLDEGAYVEALLADLRFETALAQERRPVTSIFIGGGTPSLFSGAAMQRLLDGVRAIVSCPPDMEVTLEANPGTLEGRRFHAYRQAGVNRLSIGAQSFDAGCLQRLGRIHGPDQIAAAVSVARAAGFDEINLDLMFGLPGQTHAMAMTDVRAALALVPEHISYYQLTLEPNTAFASAPPELPSEEEIWAIQCDGQGLLERRGYRQYEISAFARPRHRCRHNLNYWRFGDYLGIGAGAHGKLTDVNRGRVVRRWRVRSPERYLVAAGGGQAVSGERQLDAGDLELEFMMNALRLVQGFEPSLFRARTGLASGNWHARVQQAVADGLLERSGGRIRATGLGRRFLNDLLGRFYADP